MYAALIKYDLGKGVEAFSTRRDSVLPYPVIQGHQVHGSRVAVIDRPDYTREELEGYDAFVTALPGVAIGVRTADCVPVLLHDPVRHAIKSRRDELRTHATKLLHHFCQSSFYISFSH
jgi:copper oxidase (laccase) domain-containing protein